MGSVLRLSAVLACLVVGACASHSGVVPAGSGTFNITKQAATGFPGIGSLKAEVYQEAATYCGMQKKDFAVVSYDETKGPYILGNFPRVDLVFRCV